MTTQTLRQLEIFAQIVASGSIAECADALGMPADAIASDLHLLEERLGHRLFEIEDGETRLTPAGHRTAEAMALLSRVEPEQWQDVHAPEEPVDDAPAPEAPADPVPAVPEEGEAPLPMVEAVEPDPPPAAQAFAPPESNAAESPGDAPATEQAPPPLDAEAEEAPACGPVEAPDDEDDIFELTEVWPELGQEPLELSELPPARTEPPEETDETDGDRPRMQPAGDAMATRPAAKPAGPQPTGKPASRPMPAQPGTLAVRLAFAAPAPATAKLPTVVTLFTAVPVLPVPANDPEAMPPPAPPPVLELDRTMRQQVTVAAHPSIFGHFQEALTAFEQANPDVAINLDLNAFTAARAEPMLATGQADIIYYYAMGERERFESRYVWSESLSIFIGAEHPLARRDSVTINDLMAARPVLLGSRNGLRPILDIAMRRSGIDLWQPALETDNLMEIMAAVRQGTGYFAAFGPLARDFGRMEGIRRLPVVDPLPPVEVRQAVRDDVRDDPVVASLAEYLFR